MSPPALSAADSAYEAIKRQILDGDLEQGAMLSEGEVAERYGISRTPVREAFLRLQSEGWLRLYPKRGALVVPVRPGEVEDVVQARLIVEGASVEHVCRDESAAAVLGAHLQEILVRQRESLALGNVVRLIAADADFHQAIVDAGGNKLLADFFVSLRERQTRMSTRSLWAHQNYAERIINDHDALKHVIERRDASMFRILLDRHMREVHRDLLPDN